MGEKKIKILPTWDDLRGKVWWQIFSVGGPAIIGLIWQWMHGASRTEIGWTAIGVIVLMYLILFLVWSIRSRRTPVNQTPVFQDGSPAANPTPIPQPAKPEKLLGFKAVRTENPSAVSLMYGCDIVVENLDAHEAAKAVNVQIASFEPPPKEFYGQDIASPIPADFPIRLEANAGTTIGPGSDLRFELFKLIRTSKYPDN